MLLQEKYVYRQGEHAFYVLKRKPYSAFDNGRAWLLDLNTYSMWDYCPRQYSLANYATGKIVDIQQAVFELQDPHLFTDKDKQVIAEKLKIVMQ